MDYDQGDYVAARVRYAECLGIIRELGNKQAIAYILEAFASLAIQEAQEERCVRLWGAAAALREAIGSPLSPTDREKQERETATVQETLGETAFALAWTRGRAMTLEQSIQYASEADVDHDRIRKSAGAILQG